MSDEIGGAPVDYRTDSLGAARQGTNPTVLARMQTGWAVIGSTQHLPGYCLLIHDGEADQLTDLPRPARLDFMHDLISRRSGRNSLPRS